MRYVYTGGDIDAAAVEKLLTRHKTDRAKMELDFKYYTGQKPPDKTPSREGMADNRLNKNIAKYIVDTATGYFVGIPPVYLSEDERFEAVREIYDRNDEATVNYEIAENMGICGYGYDLVYICEEKLIHVKSIDPLTCFLVCDDSLDGKVLAGVRYWETGDGSSNKKTRGELYLKGLTKLFEMNGGKVNFTADVATPFSEPNLTEYPNNRFGMGDFESVKTLIDGYNKLISNVSDDLENTANAYLVLKGYEQPDAEQTEIIRTSRILGIDADADANYLVKNLNDQVTQNHRKGLHEDIMQTAGVPDLTDTSFASAASGEALAYKLWALGQLWARKKAQMDKALFRRLKLVADAVRLLKNMNLEDVSKMVTVKFTQNLPKNDGHIVDKAVKINGITSTQTVLETLEPVTGVNAEDEARRIEAETYADGGADYAAAFAAETGTEDTAEEAAQVKTTRRRAKKA